MLDFKDEHAICVFLLEAMEVDTVSLPVKPKEEWVHFDQVEGDKLSWMKALPPPPKPDDTQVYHQEQQKCYNHDNRVAIDLKKSWKIGMVTKNG